jgi:predicted PurR-regulated permease PerM
VANEAGARRPPARILRAGLTPGSAALLVAAVVTAFVLADAFELAHRTFGWVAACSVVALLIDPLVNAVDRFVPRWLAVIAVLLLVLAVLAALDELQESAPVAARSLEKKYSWAGDIGVTQRVTDFVDDLDTRVRKETVSKALGTAPSYVVTGILMLFLLAYGSRYFNGFADQFSPEHSRRIRTIGQEAASRGRRYLLVVIAHSIVNGLVVGLVCWAFDLPAAVSLGFLVGMLTVLPLIGVIVGGIPALLLTLGLIGWGHALVMLLVLVALQTIEALVVRPLVDPRTVRVGPTVPIVVGLVGFELYGVGGSIYGIALAVIALAALDAVGRDREASGGWQVPEQ